jgi:hypothetical protein
MVISVCQFCQKEIKYKKARTYCSNECVKQHGEQKRTFICIQCNNSHTIKKGDHRKHATKLCSYSCSGKYHSGINNSSWKGIKEERKCLVCENVFIIECSDGKTKKCCSLDCRKQATKLAKQVQSICLYCKESFVAVKRYNGNKFCSRKCADLNHGLKMRKEGNPNYLHGNANSRYPVEWNKLFKSFIRERDNHQCQVCSMTEEAHKKKLCVHHIDFDRENLSEENLVLLCKWCHGKLHGKNTREICKEELLKLLEEKKKSQNMFTI